MSMRIDGLSSGLDTSAIIEEMMALERRPINNMVLKQQELQTQKDTWRDINSRLRTLGDKFMALKLESTYLARAAKVGTEGVLQASAGQKAAEATYSIHVQELATVTTVHSDKVADLEAALGEGVLVLKDNEGQVIASLTIEAGQNLRDVVSNINSWEIDDDKAAPIRASIVDNRLVLTSKETGQAKRFSIELEPGDGALQSALGSFKMVGEGGQDALVTIDGIEVRSASNTLKDVIEDVTINLLEEGKSSLTIAHDTQLVADKLQEFVDQYNSVITFINDKLQAKSAMDANSTRGILSGDSSLLRLQSRLRSLVAGRAEDGSLFSLADIGIGTAKYVQGAADYSGKLNFDKAKLEEALAKDPLAVKELLFGKGEGADQAEAAGGILGKMEGYIRDFTKAGDGILSEKDKAYDKRIADLKRQVERMEDRLEMRENRLYAQFTAMEKALSTIYAQGDWLTTQLSQLNNMFSQPRK